MLTGLEERGTKLSYGENSNHFGLQRPYLRHSTRTKPDCYISIEEHISLSL